MKCIYDKVCPNMTDNCWRSCYRYIKFNNLVSQLNISDAAITTFLGGYVQGKVHTLKELFSQNAKIAIITFQDFYLCQFLMFKYSLYLINKFLMPLDKMPTILNITFSDVVETYFNSGIQNINTINECELLILRNYHTVTSPTGKQIINDLISSRISKGLFTIMLFETDLVDTNEGVIKHCVQNYKNTVMMLNNSNITIEEI